MAYFKKQITENKLDIHSQYFKKDMTKLRNNKESYEAEKKRIIERYKDTHEFIDPQKGQESEDKFSLIHDGIEMLWEEALLGNILFFVNKFYEPFRVFDTDEQRKELEDFIESNNIQEIEVKSWLNKNGFYTKRDFMDEAGEIQESDSSGKLKYKVLNPKTQKWECVSVLKENKAHSHYIKIDIDLSLFSVKTLKHACDEVLREKKNQIEKKEEKKKVTIKKI